MSLIACRALRPVKSLERILLDNGIYTSAGKSTENLEEPSINYLTVAVQPSKLPARQFCSVCGYEGIYKCTRCGSRYCSVKCNNNHKETRCLKFSM